MAPTAGRLPLQPRMILQYTNRVCTNTVLLWLRLTLTMTPSYQESPIKGVGSNQRKPRYGLFWRIRREQEDRFIGASRPHP